MSSQYYSSYLLGLAGGTSPMQAELSANIVYEVSTYTLTLNPET